MAPNAPPGFTRVVPQLSAGSLQLGEGILSMSGHDTGGQQAARKHKEKKITVWLVLNAYSYFLPLA